MLSERAQHFRISRHHPSRPPPSFQPAPFAGEHHLGVRRSGLTLPDSFFCTKLFFTIPPSPRRGDLHPPFEPHRPSPNQDHGPFPVPLSPLSVGLVRLNHHTRAAFRGTPPFLAEPPSCFVTPISQFFAGTVRVYSTYLGFISLCVLN